MKLLARGDSAATEVSADYADFIGTEDLSPRNTGPNPSFV
jgi:hypothetical protein